MFVKIDKRLAKVTRIKSEVINKKLANKTIRKEGNLILENTNKYISYAHLCNCINFPHNEVVEPIQYGADEDGMYDKGVEYLVAVYYSNGLLFKLYPSVNKARDELRFTIPKKGKVSLYLTGGWQILKFKVDSKIPVTIGKVYYSDIKDKPKTILHIGKDGNVTRYQGSDMVTRSGVFAMSPDTLRRRLKEGKSVRASDGGVLINEISHLLPLRTVPDKIVLVNGREIIINTGPNGKVITYNDDNKRAGTTTAKKKKVRVDKSDKKFRMDNATKVRDTLKTHKVESFTSIENLVLIPGDTMVLRGMRYDIVEVKAMDEIPAGRYDTIFMLSGRNTEMCLARNSGIAKARKESSIISRVKRVLGFN